MGAQRNHEGLGNITGAENSHEMLVLYCNGCGCDPVASISKYRLVSYFDVSPNRLYNWRCYPLF
jgi:hypothetical protein